MVTVLTSPGCQPCRFTKQRLQDRGIEFEERDVTQDEDAYRMAKELGYSATPVVIAGESHWSGLRPDLIDALA